MESKEITHFYNIYILWLIFIHREEKRGYMNQNINFKWLQMVLKKTKGDRVE